MRRDGVQTTGADERRATARHKDSAKAPALQAPGEGCDEGTADGWRDTGEVRCSTASLPQRLYRDIQPKKPEEQVVRRKFPVTPQRVKVYSSELMSRTRVIKTV